MALFPTLWKLDKTCTERVPSVSSHPVRQAAACSNSRACAALRQRPACVAARSSPAAAAAVAFSGGSHRGHESVPAGACRWRTRAAPGPRPATMSRVNPLRWWLSAALAPRLWPRVRGLHARGWRPGGPAPVSRKPRAAVGSSPHGQPCTRTGSSGTIRPCATDGKPRGDASSLICPQSAFVYFA